MLRLSRELIIKNGYVYDPINGIKGEKLDIFIKNGKIVEESAVSNQNAKVIDATGKIVMAGGIDVHSHIAAPKVNSGRKLRPEDRRAYYELSTLITRAGAGYNAPSTYLTGYQYARMGYTFVCEPAVPPLLARHAHEELNCTPNIDTALYILFGNNWIVMSYLKEKELEKCAAYVAWMLRATKGYTVKMVNPGGVEAWHWGKNVENIDDPVPYFDITPEEIIKGLIKVNEMLRLPNSAHLHTNMLGRPGNYKIALASLKLANGEKPMSISERKQVLNIAHAQFSSYGGNSWEDFESKAEEIADFVNSHDNITFDIGQITFGDSTTMTADGPLEWYLHRLNKLKWINYDVELETGAGIVPFIYREKILPNAVQWAIGLELALLIKNPMKVFLTTDNPNGGPFIKYPLIIGWLMSKKARELTIEKAHRKLSERCSLPIIDREYTIYDIACMTRAGPALAVGIAKHKGHLGVGADADVAIYDLSPEESNPAKIIKAFSRTWCTIKGGEIIVNNGKIVDIVKGRRYWVNAKVDEELEEYVLRDLRRNWSRYYTVTLDNYPVQDAYLPGSSVEIKINASHIA